VEGSVSVDRCSRALGDREAASSPDLVALAAADYAFRIGYQRSRFATVVRVAGELDLFTAFHLRAPPDPALVSRASWVIVAPGSTLFDGPAVAEAPAAAEREQTPR
jgi:hypothetical protein